MNIFVCIKQVPGTNKVDIDPVTGTLKRGGVDSKMNPYDLYALETALRLRERCGGKVSVVSMGPPQAETVIREAYAMGADEGVLLSDRRFGGADVLATSYALSQGVRRLGEFDLLLCGKQTTDGDTAQVGPELAEWLGVPSVSNVRKILEIGEDGVSVEMDMPDDVERVRVRFPCLLTVDQDIFQPRLPSYVKKTESAGRPVEILTLDEMEDREETHYGLNGSPTQVQRIFPPAVNDRRELWKEEGEALSDRLYALLRDKKFV
ncbi:MULTISPECIES: electron transfer flavoprotein subunit beta/FixA family protein [Anaerotruncus]|uniref:Electron transfer flavoprotein small subunit n=2 Tax=Anaerotruncus TaxID=244127 RepID=A0A498CV11_9FIRM|nr:MULTISPECIES: electron transfer flavoprotein subunit beta/FixA family protein [Anaerotruncus]MBC3937714.1 electron transfer flavoprotein subunit beta/FixA family protein [Anaerotruncus massiliensis (ex Togo et al. 2019)]MCQ4895759.1 electron transfer flavoprotein subunit beta/FixA family protein [Anaerotruncus sp. DFI.9.16]RLL14819.1 electron transfer flavoprotein subunit beta/FixA family protein [Anaerotruncus massiliensis (ex Liu et al. 2021)]